MMTERACQPLAISIATTRPGLLSSGSYVAPSPQRRILCKRHETELTYCPVYDFKPLVICTKGLTLAIFMVRTVLFLFLRLTGVNHQTQMAIFIDG